MATASISGVMLNVSGLTVGHQYALALYRLYPNATSYNQVARQPETGNTPALITDTMSFNLTAYLGDAGTYRFYVHIWDATARTNEDTNIVVYTIGVATVTVTGIAGTGVSSYRISDGSKNIQVASKTTGNSFTVNSGATLTVYDVVLESGYQTPCYLYYNHLSDASPIYGPNEFTGSTLISDTSFNRYLKVTASEMSKPVSPVINSVSVGKDSATVNWSGNGGSGTDGYWTLFYREGSGALTSYGIVTNSPVQVTGLKENTSYSFMVRHTIRGSGAYADSNTVTVTTKVSIGLFAWTANDAVNIAASQPIRNLTASAWNVLIGKVAACGGNTASIPTAVSGGPITAEHFNQMRNAIAALSGAGSVVSAVAQGTTKISATLFANSYSALKEAINRAISVKNQNG